MMGIGHWEDAPRITVEEDCKRFWEERLRKSTDLLLMLGLGFDPRALRTLTMIKSLGGAGRRDIHLFEFKRDDQLGYHPEQVADHRAKIEKEVAEWGNLEPIPLPMTDQDGRFVGDREAAKYCTTFAGIEKCSDLIVDISALPSSIYFPLISSLLRRIDTQKLPTNLHVMVSEQPEIDDAIIQEGGEPQYLHGFGGGFKREAEEHVPRLWAPVLGERRGELLKSIHDMMKPREICPILPFPSANPRRGDQLLREYGALLFEQWQVEPRNILYAAESNPFDVYRRLRRLHRVYSETLEPLGGVRMAVSPLSSKLLSLGTLLAAHEKTEIAVAYVVGSRHKMPDPDHLTNLARSSQLHHAWLAGDPYHV